MMMLRTRTYTLLLALLLLPALARAADPFCGDGNVDAGEECDDRNFISRDGCSTYCKLEDMTPATVTSVLPRDREEGVLTTLSEVTAVFSEPVDAASITPDSVALLKDGEPVEAEIKLLDNGRGLKIRPAKDLAGNKNYAVRIRRVKDVPGNTMAAEFLSSFTTGSKIDRIAPTVVATPAGGSFNITQEVVLKAYLEDYTASDEFLDAAARIRYTRDGTEPNDLSTLYSGPITLKHDTPLKFFAVDAAGNRSRVYTETYTFGCPVYEHAKKVTPYPACRVEECDNASDLRNNVCVLKLSGLDLNNVEESAVTAPLFASNTPLTVLSKPALRITPEHGGVIPRPVNFKDVKRGTTVIFQRGTSIKDEQGKAFEGYLLPPQNLYLKDFPIHFGYTFRSIFGFGAYQDDRTLLFDPPYKIAIPYTEVFVPSEKVTVFTYDPVKETYTAYDPSLVAADPGKTVTITAYKTGDFFVAQAGGNYNQLVFQDMESHWARNYAEILYRKGFVKGRSKGMFAPDEPMSRAEFLKVALEASGKAPDMSEEIEDAPFLDVPLFAWYLPYIKKAKELGLVSGYEDGTFKPEQPIVRAEALKMLMSAFGIDPRDFENDPASTPTNEYFTDLSTGAWYYPYVDFMVQSGIMQGVGTRFKSLLNPFGPDRALTRGEMAKITVKLLEFQEIPAAE